MAKAKTNEHLMELAKRGAKAQLADLVHEIKLLLNMFPHLHDSFDKDELPIPFLLKRAARARSKDTSDAETGKKRVLSAAARRAISNAQKKRWAAHRANAAKKS